MKRIGYQGDFGSNSEEAAKQFAKRNQIEVVEFVPLISSENVIDHLVQGRIDYGVVAVRNSIAGPVTETAKAIEGKSLAKRDALTLPIHHCLFKKPGVPLEDLDTVVSHIQALHQTRHTRAASFPFLQEEEAADTALAAIALAEHVYPDNAAVICRKNAGLDHGLELLAENIEDDPDNKTEFAFLIVCRDGSAGFGFCKSASSVICRSEQDPSECSGKQKDHNGHAYRKQ